MSAKGSDSASAVLGWAAGRRAGGEGVAAGPRMSTRPEDGRRGCLKARCSKPLPPSCSPWLSDLGGVGVREGWEGVGGRLQCLSLQPEDNLSHLKTPRKIQSWLTLQNRHRHHDIFYNRAHFLPTSRLIVAVSSALFHGVIRLQAPTDFRGSQKNILRCYFSNGL